MLKRLLVTLGILAGLFSPVHAAGTIPFSLSQQFDSLGKPLAGCKLYTIQAGTTSTPQNAYQDSDLTIALPNPMTCDAAGRLPQFFLADGSIKVRLTDKNGVQQIVADGILVIGPSSGGGGGGGSVDPTTILQTGDMKITYGTGTLSGFVRANGRTIGSASSGASERANADTQALFEYLWGADANLTVSGGRGASANADWVANKTIALPDWSGRAIAGMDDMGAGARGVLTSTYFGTSPTVLGAAGGTQAQTIAQNNLPNISPTFTGNAGTVSVFSDSSQIASFAGAVSASTGSNFTAPTIGVNVHSTGSFTPTGSISSINGGVAQQGMGMLQPTRLATIYLKL